MDKKQGDNYVPFNYSYSGAKVTISAVSTKHFSYPWGNYVFVNASFSPVMFTFGIMFKILIYAIILLFIVRFIYRFLFPVMQITRMTQSKMREMQEQMEQMQKQEQARNRQSNRVHEGDYIDYEEVK